MSFVCYVNGNKIKEFWFCEPLLETEKASEAFKMVNNFLSSKILTGKKIEIDLYGWSSSYGNESGLAALVKKKKLLMKMLLIVCRTGTL